MKSRIRLLKNKIAKTGNVISGLLPTRWLLLLIPLLMATGCKKVTEQTGTIRVCPAVLSTDPANGAINVITNKKISVTFTVTMDSASINETTFLVYQGNNPVFGVITYSGNTATFTPSVNLTANTVYTATITTGVRDPYKSALPVNYVWSFNTGAVPAVVSTDPVNGATDVVFSKLITATFSTVMDPSTINAASFTITQGGLVIPGTISYSGMVATFTPISPLTPKTVYTGTITTASKDAAGNAMAVNYNWSFATGVIPAVIATDPVNTATNILLSKVVTATFNKLMNPLTITGTTFLLKQGPILIPGVVTYTGTTATFTPTGLLTPNTVYTGTITAGVKDTAGNILPLDYVWSFTTGNAPVIISTDPVNGAVNVPLNKILAANFSTSMASSSINAATFLLKQGTNAIAGTVSYSGTTAMFTPSAALNSNTVYTATITTGAKDPSGNPLSANYTWSFTTTGSLPTVISTDPANGATNVVLNKIIAANFSSAMNAATINLLNFTVFQGAIQVTGTYNYTGTTATFTPSVLLIANTLYTGTITTGVKDVNGNAIATNYVWTFTTAPIPVIVPPVLGSAAIFGAFGGNAGITNQGINTVINGSIGTTAASTLVTGFHDGTTGDVYTETPLNVGLVSGRIYTAPPAPGSATSAAIATLGLSDANIAYLSISPASKPGGIDPGAGELGGLTLPPGIYKSASGTFNISNGNLTLDAQGNPGAIWIFQTAAGLTVGIAGPAGARSVLMINGGVPNNVYWYVGSAATINGAGGGIMSGNIIAYSGVTFSTPGNVVQTVLNGRAISLIASVTMVNTTINVPH